MLGDLELSAAKEPQSLNSSAPAILSFGLANPPLLALSPKDKGAAAEESQCRPVHVRVCA